MMKKMIFALTLLLLIPSIILAWDDCPYGEVNCPAPGDCSRYIDTDNDGICDRSQPAPENRNSIIASANLTEGEIEEIHDLISGKDLKMKTVIEIAEIYQIDATQYAQALSEYYGTTIKQTDSFQLLHDNYAMEPSMVKDIAVSIKTGQQIVVPEITSEKNKEIYHFLPISLFLIILYIVSHILSKKKIISVVKHRKIWNILLLVTFLASGALGILLVLRINLGIAIPLPFNILFWHVETGIAMMAISVFHILWHWAYFKTLFMIRK